LIQDSAGKYWLAYYVAGEPDVIWIMYSDDMNSWSDTIQVSPDGADKRDPFLVQDTTNVYWLVFEGTVGGNVNLYIRSTTNAIYWQ
jgi:hypothetical protein